MLKQLGCTKWLQFSSPPQSVCHTFPMVGAFLFLLTSKVQPNTRCCQFGCLVRRPWWSPNYSRLQHFFRDDSVLSLFISWLSFLFAEKLSFSDHWKTSDIRIKLKMTITRSGIWLIFKQVRPEWQCNKLCCGSQCTAEIMWHNILYASLTIQSRQDIIQPVCPGVEKDVYLKATLKNCLFAQTLRCERNIIAEYQLYACGKIALTPRFWTKTLIFQGTLKLW